LSEEGVGLSEEGWGLAAITTSEDAVAAIRQKSKVAVVERRAGARALTLAMRRGSEVSDGLRSPEPAIPELEISWVSGEREELEEEEYRTKLETEPEPPLPETPWI
jgi:hypothetical protein